MKQFFESISKIKYEGPSSTNPFSFKYYNPDEMINGKTMKEHLRFALTYWHTLCPGLIWQILWNRLKQR